MPRLHLTNLEGNLKLGVRAALSPRTLVVGPNGSGKTSLVHAVELLLTGGCTKVGKLPGRLVAMATAGGPDSGLNVRGALSDGRTVSFRVTGSTAKAQKPLWALDGAAVVRPLGTSLGPVLGTILRGDPAQTLRPELIRVACDGLDVDALVAQHVHESFRPLWDEAWTRALADASSPADALASVAEGLRSDARAAKKSSTVTVSEPASDPPTDEEIGAVRGKLRQAQGRIERLRADEQQARTRANFEAELVELRAKVQPEAGTAANQTVLDAFEGAVAVHAALAGRDKATCPVCEHVVEGQEVLAGLAERAKIRVAKARDRFAAAIDQQQIKQRISELEAALVGIPPHVEGAVSGSVSEVVAFAAAQEQQLVGLLQRQAESRAYLAQRTQAQRAEAQVSALKALSEAADRMVAEALEAGVRGLAERVNRHLDGSKVRFRLFDDGKPVCVVVWQGTVAGATVTAPLGTLSGAQEADVVRAFAAAWAEREAPDAVSFVAVDDVMIDAEHLSCVLRGLTDPDVGPAQALVCTVPEVAESGNLDVPDSWTVVRL